MRRPKVPEETFRLRLWLEFRFSSPVEVNSPGGRSVLSKKSYGFSAYLTVWRPKVTEETFGLRPWLKFRHCTPVEVNSPGDYCCRIKLAKKADKFDRDPD